MSAAWFATQGAGIIPPTFKPPHPLIVNTPVMWYIKVYGEYLIMGLVGGVIFRGRGL